MHEEKLKINAKAINFMYLKLISSLFYAIVEGQETGKENHPLS
jgi:hypothetical protein